MGKRRKRDNNEYEEEDLESFLNYGKKMNMIEEETIEEPEIMDDKQFFNGENPLFVLSDFHGGIQAMDYAMKVLETDKKVVILGDCMDRGHYGFKMLTQIKDLVEEGKTLSYLPGNHDMMLFDEFYDMLLTYQSIGPINEIFDGDSSLNDEQRNDFLNQIRQKYENICEEEKRFSNYRSTTIFSVLQECERDLSNIDVFMEDLNWLGNQPLLKIEKDADGKRIALGHASFDMELYEDFKGTFCLYDYRKFKRIYEQNDDSKDVDVEKAGLYYNKAKACVWYRDIIKDQFPALILPTENEADQIVVGHTPNQQSMPLYGANINREAIVVDGNVYNQNIYAGRELDDGILFDPIELIVYQPTVDTEPRKVKTDKVLIPFRHEEYEMQDDIGYQQQEDTEYKAPDFDDDDAR